MKSPDVAPHTTQDLPVNSRYQTKHARSSPDFLDQTNKQPSRSFLSRNKNAYFRRKLLAHSGCKELHLEVHLPTCLLPTTAGYFADEPRGATAVISLTPLLQLLGQKGPWSVCVCVCMCVCMCVCASAVHARNCSRDLALAGHNLRSWKMSCPMLGLPRWGQLVGLGVELAEAISGGSGCSGLKQAASLWSRLLVVRLRLHSAEN